MATEFYRSLGLEVTGPKNDRTSIAVLDFYPKTERLILVDLEIQLSGFDDTTSDEMVVKTFDSFIKEAPSYTGCGVHAPLTLPPLLQAAIANDEAQPFALKNKNAEIVWMIELWKRLRPRPRPFVPYLERAAELYLRYMTREKFQVSEAMGANLAPISARIQFLKNHLPGPLHEVHPRATLSRVISSLGMPKTLIRDFTDLERGIYTREQIFVQLSKKIPQLFIYEKDLELMVLNINCFNAFLCALMQHLIFKEQQELAPKNFPKAAGWIHLPKTAINWNTVFGA